VGGEVHGQDPPGMAFLRQEVAARFEVPHLQRTVTGSQRVAVPGERERVKDEARNGAPEATLSGGAVPHAEPAFAAVAGHPLAVRRKSKAVVSRAPDGASGILPMDL